MSEGVGDCNGAGFATASPFQEDAELDASQPAWTFSELEDFARSSGLHERLDVLSKAALLLQGELPEEIPGLDDHEIKALHDDSVNKWQQPRLLYFTVLVCSLGAVEQGLAQTGMNGANLYFPEALSVGSDSARDRFIVGLINSGIFLGAGLCGAWLSEPLNNRLGRRGAIFLGSVLCFLANLGSAVSWNWQILLFFRLLLGMGMGINSSTVSVFAAECAPASIRGGLAVSWQMWTAFGVFLGFVANVAVYDYGPNTWRLQLAAPFIPVVPLLMMVYMCPESPAWYIKKGQYDLAYRSLAQLRNTEVQAAKELYASHLQQQARSKFVNLSSSYLSKLADLVTNPRIRHASQASFTVMLSQQLCGINIIAFYSSTIFSNAGFSAFGALIASCVFGFVNFLGAFPAIWAMDTLGRRSLLLLTLPFMALTMLAAGLSFRIPEGNVQLGLLASLIYLFCAEYSPGMGPVPSAYSAEVFPLSHREVGMSSAVATGNFWAAVLSVTFPTLLGGLGPEGTFELYATWNLLAWALVFLFVRETKRKTLDELDEVFAVETSVFVRFQVMEQVPSLWRRYILRKKDMDGKPVILSGGYRELRQDGEVDDLQ